LRNFSRNTPSLRELTVKKLREAILAGHLAPGERLVQQDLCDRTGVSRTCVREALQQLEAEGLVERSPTKGHLVASISPAEARQIYEIRAALEPAMARLFVERATAGQAAQLRGVADSIETAIRAGDMKRYVEGLAEFYAVLLSGAGNEIGRRFLSTLHARITYLRRVTAERAEPERRLETLRLLRTIVEAAKAKDAAAIAARCHEFVMRSARFALAVLDGMSAAGQPAGGRRASA
jgi:DNA-binding GntR family transcriptional regulator